MFWPLLAPLVVASGLGVAATSPTVDCPSPAEVADAVGRRMPARSDGGAADWNIRYGWEGAPPARAVTFRLLAPDGTAALERRFPLEKRECLAAAATIAVIVERYFRELGWTTGASLPPVNVATIGPVRAPGRAIDAERRETLRLSAGGAVRVAGGTADAAMTIGARVRLGGPLHLGLSVLVPPASTSQKLMLGGQASVDEWQARLYTWAVLAGSRVEWGAGLDALLGLQAASSSRISEPAQKTRGMFALGVGAGPSYLLGRRWRIALELAVYRTLAATTFYVTENGRDTDVLAAPGWRLLGALSIGYVLVN